MREAGLQAPTGWANPELTGPSAPSGPTFTDIDDGDHHGLGVRGGGSLPVDCVGIHAAKSGNRFEALEPIRQGVAERFAGFGAWRLSSDDQRSPTWA